MKLYDGALLILVSIAVLTGIVMVANEHFGAKDDNLAEEVIEEAIEITTGLDVDLTPLTPEEEESLKKAYKDWSEKNGRTSTKKFARD